ncbi:hypothetical protein DOY81_001229 [Sarcophaga bullata]|nr:hypothetical protein DOY81_001229 [Sarcophaga bullata]
MQSSSFHSNLKNVFLFVIHNKQCIRLINNDFLDLKKLQIEHHNSI